MPPVSGLHTCYVHNNCVGNEEASLCNRHLQELPEPTREGIRGMRRHALRAMAVFEPVAPISPEEFWKDYSGPKRSRYVNAWESLKTQPLRRSDAYLSSFIKAEKTNPFAKCNPDPRLIQARSPRYNIEVGRWLRPMFKQFKKLKDPVGTRIIVKGLNMVDRAALAVEKWSRFDCPVWIKMDASRFDAHLALPKLLILHSVYNHCARDREFARRLAWQRKNRGRTAGGIRYTSIGRRCSGDFDTGDGNSLDMTFEVKDVMEYLGIHKWAGSIDGDDVGIIIERKHLGYFRKNISQAFLRLGTEMKVEGIAFELSEVSQCQSSLLELEPCKWLFVRDWKKVLSQDTSGMKHWGQPSVVRSMLKTVGIGSLAMFVGLPILQEYALALLRLGGNSKVRSDLILLDDLAHRFQVECRDAFNQFAMGNVRPKFVSTFARLSFARTFGVTTEQQLHIECSLRRWQLSSELPKLFDSEWDNRWEDLRHPDNTEND
jgi:hypothetical protein